MGGYWRTSSPIHSDKMPKSHQGQAKRLHIQNYWILSEQASNIFVGCDDDLWMICCQTHDIQSHERQHPKDEATRFCSAEWLAFASKGFDWFILMQPHLKRHRHTRNFAKTYASLDVSDRCRPLPEDWNDRHLIRRRRTEWWAFVTNASIES